MIATGLLQSLLDPLDHLASLGRPGYMLRLLGRHIPGSELPKNLDPAVRGIGIAKIRPQVMQGHLSFLLPGSMTLHAISFKKGRRCLSCQDNRGTHEHKGHDS